MTWKMVKSHEDSERFRASIVAYCLRINELRIGELAIAFICTFCLFFIKQNNGYRPQFV